MIVPGIVIGYHRPVEEREKEYFDFINYSILNQVSSKGRKRKTSSGIEYEFQNEHVRLRYLSSFYCNNQYYIEINQWAWDDVPKNLRHIVTEDGWNFVYQYQDSPDRQIIHHHIPGSWMDMFGNPRKHPDISRLLEEKKTMIENSVFIGDNATNVQVQNYSPNSSQVMGETFDVQKCQSTLDKINRYRDQFPAEFGENSPEIIIALEDAQKAVNEKDLPRWKKAIKVIKDICIGTAGSLIASGILSLIA